MKNNIIDIIIFATAGMGIGCLLYLIIELLVNG